MDVKLFGSATLEEIEYAYKMALNGNDEDILDAPESISRAKVRMMVALFRKEIIEHLL